MAGDPLLSRHRDSFTLLPALAEAEISSTTVRKRFYAGEDCAHLIPAAAVDVLKRHEPDEFTITYEQRMKTIIQSGRFGANTARIRVYRENADLFRHWKDGNAEIDLGDYQTFLDDTKLYREAYDVSGLGTTYPTTETGCVNADCVDVAQHLIAAGYNPAILNLASAQKPGGAYQKGSSAQEEALCRSSNLSLSLYQFGDPTYKHIQECGVPHKAPGYPLDLNYGGIYTPNVTFFRNNQSKYFTLKEQPFRCDVITVAALSFSGRNDYSLAEELRFRAADGGFNPDGEAVMLNKIRTIFRMGVEHGKDALVLGAFGCGVYKLPVPDVVRLFRVVMEEPEFANKFRLIVFAILESTRKPNGLDGKFPDFYREFGAYNF